MLDELLFRMMFPEFRLDRIGRMYVVEAHDSVYISDSLAVLFEVLCEVTDAMEFRAKAEMN